MKFEIFDFAFLFIVSLFIVHFAPRLHQQLRILFHDRALAQNSSAAFVVVQGFEQVFVFEIGFLEFQMMLFAFLAILDPRKMNVQLL